MYPGQKEDQILTDDFLKFMIDEVFPEKMAMKFSKKVTNFSAFRGSSQPFNFVRFLINLIVMSQCSSILKGNLIFKLVSIFQGKNVGGGVKLPLRVVKSLIREIYQNTMVHVSMA